MRSCACLGFYWLLFFLCLGGWMAWSLWSACDDSGLQMRSRVCGAQGNTPCVGNSTQRRDCNEIPGESVSAQTHTVPVQSSLSVEGGWHATKSRRSDSNHGLLGRGQGLCTRATCSANWANRASVSLYFWHRKQRTQCFCTSCGLDLFVWFNISSILGTRKMVDNK